MARFVCGSCGSGLDACNPEALFEVVVEHRRAGPRCARSHPEDVWLFPTRRAHVRRRA